MPRRQPGSFNAHAYWFTSVTWAALHTTRVDVRSQVIYYYIYTNSTQIVHLPGQSLQSKVMFNIIVIKIFDLNLSNCSAILKMVAEVGYIRRVYVVIRQQCTRQLTVSCAFFIMRCAACRVSRARAFVCCNTATGTTPEPVLSRCRSNY